MKIKRLTLLWGLGLLITGIAVFTTVVALQLSPIHSRVDFWDKVLLAAFLTTIFGAALIALVVLTLIPDAFRLSQRTFRLSQQHLQTHGKTYSTVFFAIMAGLGGLFIALIELVKTYGPAVAEMMDTDVDNSVGMWSGNPDSVWSETEADVAGPGSYEWSDRYL